MIFKRLGGALVAAALLGTVGFGVTATQASAETIGGTATTSDAAVAGTTGTLATTNAQLTPQTQTLCAQRGCALTVPVSVQLGSLVEGAAIPVNVEGTGNAQVPIQAWAYKYVDENTYQLAKISNSVVARTDATGYVRINLTAVTPPAGFNGNQVILQTADFTPGKAMIGDSVAGGKVEVIEVYTSRGADMGFSETQFGSDGIFHRKVNSAVPGHKYSVQLLRGGKWTTIDNAGPAAVSKYGTAAVQARVPKGLPTGKYRTRIVNVTKGLSDLSPDLAYTYFTWSNTPPKPTDPGFNVYTTPGTWNYNGRLWKTSCEPYSATERCRTEIWATQITHRAGKFTRTDGYVFNNLTYKPSARSLWSKNPLGGYAQVGFNKAWTGEDGRKWRTECDTTTSGRNGCRSYIWATVAEPQGSGYRVVNRWLFNNIVQFG